MATLGKCEIDGEFLKRYLSGKMLNTDEMNQEGHFESQISRLSVSSSNEGHSEDHIVLGPSEVNLSSVGIFAKESISKGTRLGRIYGRKSHDDPSPSPHSAICPSPTQSSSFDKRSTTVTIPDLTNGKVTKTFNCKDNPAQDIHEYSWEMISNTYRISAIVSRCEPGWLRFIQSARNISEQNIDAVNMGDQMIVLVATKLISSGSELLVWYDSSLPQYMGLPEAVWPRLDQVTSQQPHTHIIGANSHARIQCVLCHRGFNSRSNLRSHMRTHTLERPFPCRHCGRSFSQSSTLRNHLRLHTGERPYKCRVCQKSYSQLAGLRAHQKSSMHRPALK